MIVENRFRTIKSRVDWWVDGEVDREVDGWEVEGV
jgi:hypothetical protein